MHHFTQLIKKPTRITQESSTLMDLIASNNPQNMSRFGVISSGLIDHDMINCVRKLNWRKAPAQVKTFRNYANYNLVEFCEDLKHADWNMQVNSHENGNALVADVELM